MQHIEVRMVDRIWVVLLNRPAQRNALNIPMLTELQQVIEDAASDQNCVGLALSANGPAFCSGVDLKATSPSAVGVLLREVYRGLCSLRKPIAVAVHGHVVGGGTILLLAADLVIAGRSACVSLPELRLGFRPEFLWNEWRRRYPGASSAVRSALLTGGEIRAEKLAATSAIWKVVPDEEAVAIAVECVASMSDLAVEHLLWLRNGA